MICNDWTDDLTPEDFPEPFEPFINVLGIKLTVELAERLGGMQYYLPKIDKVRMVAIKRVIIRERCQGEDYRTLARKYRVTETFVRQLCDAKARQAAGDRQMQLFNQQTPETTEK